MLCSVIWLPNLRRCRTKAAAAWLPDGRIFVIGGKLDSEIQSWSDTVEMYARPWNKFNIVRNRWENATPMPDPVVAPSAALFRGKIFVVGTDSTNIFSPPSEADDSEPGQWTGLLCPYNLTHIFSRDNHLFAIGISIHFLIIFF